jgi:peptide/nickel transport system substrate-binding protein
MERRQNMIDVHMPRGRAARGGIRSVGVMAVLVALVGAACGGSKGPVDNPTGTGGPSTHGGKGGVYRTAIEDFGFTGAFDPTGEYLGTAQGLLGQLLMRNLVTYKHVRGVNGDDIVPDLATNTGDVSADGLTYTFHLKPGLKWGPPLSRAITSKDVLFAFQRIDSAPLVAQYGFYYDGTIEGMTGVVDKKAQDIKISGIQTPDDSTISFKLSQPTGDFLYRLAMPAAAPMPVEVAGCFTRAGDYGRDVVSSGPYMLKGMDQVDASSCKAIKPAEGFDPTKFMKIVRNPNYDPKTDDTTVRSNNVDGVVIEINTNTDDIFNKISTGDLDGSLASQPPAQVLQQYVTDSTLKPYFHSDPGDRTWYITMNLLVPPFDDIHVRKAVNFVINKQALQKAWGGPLRGEIATHIMPPTVLDFGGQQFDPFPSPNHAGDVKAAKAEMRQSKYDSNGDGLCDSDVCKNVLFINRTTPPHVNMTPTIQENLASLGIDLKVRELDTGTAYTTIQTVKNLIPIAANAGWGKDYADASTFGVLFISSGILCEGQVNYPELGMTQAIAKRCGVEAEWAAAGGTSIPNVDQQFNDCSLLSGQPRTDCWIEFDKNLTQNIAPWVPYLWANSFTIVAKSVTHYEFDQFSGVISLCHISVNNKVSAASL